MMRLLCGWVVLGLFFGAIGQARSGFQAPLSFDAGSTSVFVAVGDFNGDGIPDLAVANGGGHSTGDQGTVSILLGKGDGTFQAAVDYTANRAPSSVAVGDFNGDGKPDLVVSNYGSNDVSVLLGNGDGTFQAAVDYPVGTGPYCVAVADFNGDGIPDLAVANSSSGSVSILLGNGDGTFQAAANSSVGDSLFSLAMGDFNGDGHIDLAVPNYVGNGFVVGTVSVLLGNGDGTFQPAQGYAAGIGPVAVAVSDFNRDGIPDLAVVNNGFASGTAATVSILLGNGDGTFQAANNFAVGLGPETVAVGDVNGDGILDLAVSNLGGNTGGSVSVLLGNGDGSFEAAQTYAAGWSFSRQPTTGLSKVSNCVAIADFNGDGKPDLVVANGGGNNASVLLGHGDGTFQAAPTYSAGNDPSNLAVGDFNADGILDIAVASTGGASVRVLLGNGDGTFQAPVDSPADRATLTFVALGDFNRDGIPDLVVANYDADTVSVLLGNGDGTFQSPIDSAVGPAPYSVAVADFNGDGIPDLAVANSAETGGKPSVSVLLGNGDGTFQPAVNYAAGKGTYSVAVADFNGDGIPDLVMANAGIYPNYSQGGSVAVLLGKGDGTFHAAVNYVTGLNPESVGVGDFNGDGILDVAVANLFSNDVSVLLGKGDGTLQAAVNYTVGPIQIAESPSCLAVRDFNSDGIPDLAVVFGGGVRVLLGNGDGTFQTTPISYLAGVGPIAVAVGDFNGDGFPDLAVLDFGPGLPSFGGDVAILINDGKWSP
jgi:uncharacterized protein (UPF0548 family)